MTINFPPTIAELRDSTRYRPFVSIPHANIAASIRPYLHQWTSVIAAYWILNAAALLWLVVAWRMSGENLLSGFSIASLGMVGGYLMLLPIHEALHGLAYWLTGAKKVRIRYEWRRITAHCVADRAVVGRGAFAFVCLLPFTVLNPLVFVLGLTFQAGPWQLATAAAFLLHTGAVSGDVALVNLLWSTRGSHEVWTYDDVEAGQTYFFVTAGAEVNARTHPAA